VRTLGRRWRWLGPLARRYVDTFTGRIRPRHAEVVRFLIADADFKAALRKYAPDIAIHEWIAEPQHMRPVAVARAWRLPLIESAGGLAEWLSLSIPELEWFADLKTLGSKLRNPKLEHYRYRILPKASGGLRLTESPKQRLKRLQRRILSEILDWIPLHPAVHGFARGRSIVSFAMPHVGAQVLLRLDLQDFFPSVPGARVQAMFRTLGYPETVADLLGGICTNVVSAGVWDHRPLEISRPEWQRARILYNRPHLPQGAPTSPALANLIAYHLDCRLSGLAKASGAQYTRYADDLAFSGGEEFNRAIQRFLTHAAAIAIEEGFAVNHHKTRIMRRGVRQQLAGIVVNQKAGLHRRDVELLEATLTNCVRFGPESQNRAGLADFHAHLEGRIGYLEMVDRIKGQRLRTLFQSIEWQH
jgi:RNA-directed DNA polymerase